MKEEDLKKILKKASKAISKGQKEVKIKSVLCKIDLGSVELQVNMALN
jgi:hypothetical protein